jgi:predicted  nucleic acid-binding Zn-ribbon protein
MEDTFFVPRTDAEYEAAIEQMLAEMRRLNERMKDDQTAIERLKAETRALKEETDAVKARLRARLDALANMVAA